MRKSDAFPIVALALAAIGAMYVWATDGGFSQDEMGPVGMISLMLWVVSMLVALFGSMAIAVRRAWLDRDWFWLAMFALGGPVAFVPYQLFVNRGHEA